MPTAVRDGSLMVANRLSELPRVARWIHAWAEHNRVPREAADRLDLCSTELVTNIVSHAYDDQGTGHQIRLTLRREGDVLALEIEDDGRPFNPLEVDAPPVATSLDDVPIGGCGVAIVRRVSDGLRYERAEGRNRCTVLQRCSVDEPPERDA